MTEKHTYSFVWQFFERNSQNETAKCMKCNKILKCKGSTTSGQLRHLKNIHNITEKNWKEPLEKTEMKNKTQITLDKYVKKPDRVAILAKMVAVDFIIPYTIVKSEFIRKAFLSMNLDLPKSSSTIAKLVYDHFIEMKEFLKRNY